MIRQIATDFRERWKPLLLTSFVYKLITVIFLAPLVALPLQLAISLSSNQVLTDQDILYFFVTPAGLLSLIAVGALFISISALELTALLAILASDRGTVGPIKAIHFAYQNKFPVLRLTARVTAILVVITAPFLIVAGLIYVWLLSEHDINFYMQQNPPEFQTALVLGGVLLTIWLVFVLRLVANWYLAVGLVAFDVPSSAKSALQESQDRSRGFRRKILTWLLIWLAASFLLSTLSAGIIVVIARAVIPGMRHSLSALVPAIGLALLVWLVVNLLVNLFCQGLFAAIYFRLFQQRASDVTVELPSLLTVSDKPDAAAADGFTLTRTKLIVGLMIGLVVVVSLGIFLTNSLRLDDKVDIIAHRGSSQAAPENTLAAIRQSIADEADWVEIDVQETADGEVVVFHDSDFMKMANNPLKIWDATRQNLQSIDIGSWFHKKFRDERVPTLQQVLQVCKGKIRVLIELKYYGHDVDLEKRVAEIVESAEMVDQIEIMSLKSEAVNKMKALRPAWRVGFLMSVSTGDLQSINADFLAINASFVDRTFIKSANRNQQTVMVWTVNDAVSMSSMMGLGVDGIITDLPDLGRMVLAQRAQLSVGERLMLELAEIFGIPPSINDQ